MQLKAEDEGLTAAARQLAEGVGLHYLRRYYWLLVLSAYLLQVTPLPSWVLTAQPQQAPYALRRPWHTPTRDSSCVLKGTDCSLESQGGF